MRMSTLKLRAGHSGRPGVNEPDRFFFSVPNRIAQLLPDDQEYECLLTEDGVLFRPVDAGQGESLPAWVRKRNEGKE